MLLQNAGWSHPEPSKCWCLSGFQSSKTWTNHDRPWQTKTRHVYPCASTMYSKVMQSVSVCCAVKSVETLARHQSMPYASHSGLPNCSWRLDAENSCKFQIHFFVLFVLHSLQMFFIFSSFFFVEIVSVGASIQSTSQTNFANVDRWPCSAMLRWPRLGYRLCCRCSRDLQGPLAKYCTKHGTTSPLGCTRCKANMLCFVTKQKEDHYTVYIITLCYTYTDTVIYTHR